MSFFTSKNALAKTYWFICDVILLRGFHSKMLAHIHIFVVQQYKNLSFAFTSKLMPLKSDWLVNQYSLTFWGQDALQSEEMTVLAKLKAHSFVYNYRRCRTL